jgi:AcrR family transcriptional regulator
MKVEGLNSDKRHWRDGEAQGERIPRDGRSARAVRTRQAVVEALLILIEEGELRPTSKAIAERAGVSERTIFQHFEDLETLFRAAADRMGEGIVRNLGVIPCDGPLDERLELYLDELTFLHESMTPIRRASRLHEPFSPTIRCALGTWRANLRRGIENVFAIELERWPNDESRRKAIEALALIATWSSWENMRTNSGFTCVQAREVLEFGLRSLLTGSSGVAPN